MSMKGLIAAGALAASAISLGAPSQAATVAEPAVFQSAGGVLNLLMIARTTTASGITMPGYNPIALGYQVCYRPASGNVCPAGAPTSYGGVRLALQPGDLLKIHFINQLPAVDPATLDRQVDDPLLKLDPTNLHTHGLVVDATANTAIPPNTPVYGDFIFTSIFNPANGDPAQVNLGAYNQLHAHGDVVKDGVVDYNIKLPANHPRGMFWFHPHMHGIAVNQVSAGLSGIISVGNVSDYACADEDCQYPVPDSAVRNLILKEMQVFPTAYGGIPHHQTDAAFCQPDPQPGEAPRNGFCPADLSVYPQGGDWFYTLNGQQYPTIPIRWADGEIWRFTNASASGSYDLTLTDDKSGRTLPMQIVSMDGVSVDIPQGTASGDVVQLSGGRIRYTTCPTQVVNAKPGAIVTHRTTLWAPTAPASANNTIPVCATEIIMMPSSRVEVWATYTDAQNRLAQAPAGQTATLKTLHYNTGPTGDDWPAINLAKVSFVSGLRQYGATQVYLRGDALRTVLATGIFKAAHEGLTGTATIPPECKPIAAGHRRRVFFANMGNDDTGNPIFGLGYEETDKNGVPVAGTFHPVERFDPAHEICLPLGPGNTARNEVWELVNLSAELHNFHIHQTKFKVLRGGSVTGSLLSDTSGFGEGVMEDNVPLPFAKAADGYTFPETGACTVDDYRAGKCLVSPVLVKIPFARLGRFVFHCHILEHEDGGMMHSIRVVRYQ